MGKKYKTEEERQEARKKTFRESTQRHRDQYNAARINVYVNDLKLKERLDNFMKSEKYQYKKKAEMFSVMIDEFLSKNEF